MSRATKSKYVQREILDEEIESLSENQTIVKVLGSRGNNLHEVETPESSSFLVSMPTKFRKNVWIKKGDFIVVEPIEEGDKVKAEIVKVLTPTNIKHLKKKNLWPVEFLEDKELQGDNENNDDLFVNHNHSNLVSENFDSTESESE